MHVTLKAGVITVPAIWDSAANSYFFVLNKMYLTPDVSIIVWNFLLVGNWQRLRLAEFEPQSELSVVFRLVKSISTEWFKFGQELISQEIRVSMLNFQIIWFYQLGW